MGTVAGTEVRTLQHQTLLTWFLLFAWLTTRRRYFETSASSGQNIQEVFDSLFATVVGKLGVGGANNSK